MAPLKVTVTVADESLFPFPLGVLPALPHATNTSVATSKR
jgi:hypothetical protein